MSYDSKITETDLNVLRLIEENPEISQRMMASKLGHSLGKINYSIKLLTDIGFLKIKNFSKSQNKSGYIYVLTPRAIKQKLIIAKKFLAKKHAEYETLYNYIHNPDEFIKKE